MRTSIFVLLVLLSESGTARSDVGLAPYIGVIAESDIVNSSVLFSDGSNDFVAIEPDLGFQFGLELSVPFGGKLNGVLGLSYSVADARYTEDNNRRPDVGIATLRLQPGLIATIVDSGKVRLGLGGGLTFGRTWIDGMRWNDNPIEPRATLLGLFGTAGLDIGLSARVALHTHLVIELNGRTLGDLEEEIAFADNETGASVDGDIGTALGVALGVSFAL